MTRTTKKEVEATFDLFLKSAGLKKAEGYDDVGGYMLDFAGVYGGYVVVRICNEGGGQSTPFGWTRRPAGQMADTLRFAADAARIAKGEL